ncbi:MAG: hypothetical protein K4571_07195 [Deltaproteobacteria bacterium]
MIFICVTGCAGGFGKFFPDDRVTSAFETYQINPDYRYYIAGSGTYPVAVLAFDKSYKMGNDLWEEIKLTPASMKDLVDLMQLRLMSCCGQMWSGFLVIDPLGKQIGILYAYVGAGISFRVEKDNVVRLYGPRDDDQMKKYQDRQKR